MKILYIDPESYRAHINYNKLQIEALKEISSDLSFCFKSGYAKYLNLNDKISEIPQYLYKMHSNSLINRIFMLMRYIYILIKYNVNLLNYDAIIISYYDEFSLFFSPFPKKTYLINHVNIAGIFKNKIKRLVFKIISKRYHQIVLDEKSQEYLTSLKIKNVIVVNHGLVKEYEGRNNISFENMDNVIFCPSARSVDKALVDSIVSNSQLIKYLKDNNYKLILKGNYNIKENDVVQIINRFISEKEYRNLIVKSKFLLLPYPKDFIYRTSGVLLEAIANKKTIFINSIPSLLQYKKYYTDIHEFKNADSFFSELKDVINNPVQSIDANLESLQPNYSFLRNKHNS